jgi:hypothetical protein
MFLESEKINLFWGEAFEASLKWRVGLACMILTRGG